jgi:hypothetical protein
MVRSFSDPSAKDVLDTLRDLATDDANRDGAQGGVHQDRIGRELGKAGSTVQQRLHALESLGRVVQAAGISPEGNVRHSWLPADHPDAETGPEQTVPRHPSEADD